MTPVERAKAMGWTQEVCEECGWIDWWSEEEGEEVGHHRGQWQVYRGVNHPGELFDSQDAALTRAMELGKR